MTDAQALAIIAAIIRETSGGVDVGEAVAQAHLYLIAAKARVE